MVGSSVTLRCAGSDLKWEEYVSDAAGPVEISSGDTNYAPMQYDLSTTEGRYDLTIKSLALIDAGKYRCKVVRGDTAYAEVIVFNGKTKRSYFYILVYWIGIGSILLSVPMYKVCIAGVK